MKPFGSIFNLLLYNNLVLAYDVASTFASTHEQAIDTMKEVLGEDFDVGPITTVI